MALLDKWGNAVIEHLFKSLELESETLYLRSVKLVMQPIQFLKPDFFSKD